MSRMENGRQETGECWSSVPNPVAKQETRRRVRRQPRTETKGQDKLGQRVRESESDGYGNYGLRVWIGMDWPVRAWGGMDGDLFG